MWRDTATADPERARHLATRLERRARAVDEIAARDAYLDLLDIVPVKRVLDVGCGSGAVTREINPDGYRSYDVRSECLSRGTPSSSVTTRCVTR